MKYRFWKYTKYYINDVEKTKKEYEEYYEKHWTYIVLHWTVKYWIDPDDDKQNKVLWIYLYIE